MIPFPPPLEQEAGDPNTGHRLVHKLILIMRCVQMHACVTSQARHLHNCGFDYRGIPKTIAADADRWPNRANFFNHVLIPGRTTTYQNNAYQNCACATCL